MDQDLNRIRFYDDSYKLLITFVNLFNDKPAVWNLNGKYEMQLAKVVLNLNVDNERMVISGCNIHTFDYIAFEDGTIEFGPAASTERACQDDVDIVFLTNVIRSTNYNEENGKVLFQNDDGETYAVAKRKSNVAQNPQDTSPPKPPTTIQPRPTRVYLKEGKYTIKILRSNLPTLPF